MLSRQRPWTPVVHTVELSSPELIECLINERVAFHTHSTFDLKAWYTFTGLFFSLTASHTALYIDSGNLPVPPLGCKVQYVEISVGSVGAILWWNPIDTCFFFAELTLGWVLTPSMRRMLSCISCIMQLPCCIYHLAPILCSSVPLISYRH